MGRKRKDENKIYVNFLGESRNDVTGSSVLLNIPRKDGTRYNVLIEMGMAQSNTIKQDLANNRKMLERFNKDLISSIEHVFINHFHCDHHMNLPFLEASGCFEGDIIMPKDTMPILKHLMVNGTEIHEANVQKLRDLGEKHLKPFYTKQDTYSLFNRFVKTEIGEKIKLNDEIEYQFLNSGHVLGGAMLKLWIRTPNNTVKTLLYSSDMGSDYNNEFQYYVPLRDEIKDVQYFISEATYNKPERSWTRKQAIEERRKLKQDIKNYLCSGKEILFSSFSAGRLQNIIAMLYDFYNEEEWFRDIPVIIDGVLLHKVNNDYLNILQGEDLQHFKRVMNWKNLKQVKDFTGTKTVLSKHEPRIIISTSGFLTNGRIVTYLQSLLDNSKCVFYLTGYCGNEDSLGGQILNPNQKTVTIEKKVILKRAEIKQLKTFSSHIQCDELIKLYKGLHGCRKIIIHHSSEKDKSEFGELVREELRKIDSSTKVEVVTHKNYQFVI